MSALVVMRGLPLTLVALTMMLSRVRIGVLRSAESRRKCAHFCMGLDPSARRPLLGRCEDMAILPAWRGRGMGAALMGSVQRAAHGLGATRAIHALGHDDNPSTRRAGDRARPMRRYALLARAVA